ASKFSRHVDGVAQRWRSEQAFVSGVQQNVAQTLSFFGVDVRIDVVDGKFLACEWRRCRGKRLRRPRLFAGHVALWNRPFFDRPQGLARRAIEHVYESELGRLRHDIYWLTVVPHGEQLG